MVSSTFDPKKANRAFSQYPAINPNHYVGNFRTEKIKPIKILEETAGDLIQYQMEELESYTNSYNHREEIIFGYVIRLKDDLVQIRASKMNISISHHIRVVGNLIDLHIPENRRLKLKLHWRVKENTKSKEMHKVPELEDYEITNPYQHKDVIKFSEFYDIMDLHINTSLPEPKIGDEDNFQFLISNLIGSEGVNGDRKGGMNTSIITTTQGKKDARVIMRRLKNSFPNFSTTFRYEGYRYTVNLFDYGTDAEFSGSSSLTKTANEHSFSVGSLFKSGYLAIEDLMVNISTSMLLGKSIFSKDSSLTIAKYLLQTQNLPEPILPQNLTPSQIIRKGIQTLKDDFKISYGAIGNTRYSPTRMYEDAIARIVSNNNRKYHKTTVSLKDYSDAVNIYNYLLVNTNEEIKLSQRVFSSGLTKQLKPITRQIFFCYDELLQLTTTTSILYDDLIKMMLKKAYPLSAIKREIEYLRSVSALIVNPGSGGRGKTITIIK